MERDCACVVIDPRGHGGDYAVGGSRVNWEAGSAKDWMREGEYAAGSWKCDNFRNVWAESVLVSLRGEWRVRWCSRSERSRWIDG